jgi:hypothetical protein
VSIVPIVLLLVSTPLPACYTVGFRHDADAFGLSRERFVTALRMEGIAFDTADVEEITQAVANVGTHREALLAGANRPLA